MAKDKKTSQKKAAKAPANKQVQATSAPRSRMPASRLAVLALAAVLALICVWVFLPFSSQSGPSKTVKTAWTAVKTQDLETFQKVVATESFVKSLIEQVIAYEEINTAGEAGANNFRQLMSQGMIGAFRNDLAATYNQQLNELVETGNLDQRKDGLLWRLWQQTGAKPEYFQSYELLDQNDSNALMTLNFKRTDLGDTMLSLNLLLEFNEATESWQITGAPNLANFLFTISTRQKEELAKMNAPIQKRLNETVTILDVQKAAGVGQAEAREGVLWHVAYRNNSSRNVASFKADIRIENAEGHYLGTLEIIDTDGLASGQTAERAWPMPLNPNNTADAEILTASSRVLNPKVSVKEVIYKNGDKLTLLTELPTPVEDESAAAE